MVGQITEKTESYCVLKCVQEELQVCLGLQTEDFCLKPYYDNRRLCFTLLTSMVQTLLTLL